MGKTDLGWVRGVLFDLDGVIYLGSTALPGAQEIFDWLESAGRPFCLVTNNSTRTALQYQEKLAEMGIQVALDKIFTSALATAQYLKKEYPAGAPVYAIGETGLHQALADAGFTFDEAEPRIVCVGLDQQLTYEKLRIACVAIRHGARFIATNPDRTLPTEAGLVPGCGSILAAVETSTEVAPLVIGKPSRRMIDLALERIGLAPDEALMVGDRLDTDVEAGKAGGVRTTLILTGVHHLADVPAFPVAPDFVVNDLSELRAALAGEPAATNYQPGLLSVP